MKSILFKAIILVSFSVIPWAHAETLDGIGYKILKIFTPIFKGEVVIAYTGNEEASLNELAQIQLADQRANLICVKAGLAGVASYELKEASYDESHGYLMTRDTFEYITFIAQHSAARTFADWIPGAGLAEIATAKRGRIFNSITCGK